MTQPPGIIVIVHGDADRKFDPYHPDDRECALCGKPIGWVAWDGSLDEDANRWKPFYSVGNHAGPFVLFCASCWEWLKEVPREVTSLAELSRVYDNDDGRTMPCPVEVFVADDHNDCPQCEGRMEVAFRGMKWPVLMNCPTCGGPPHPLVPHARTES